MLYQPIAAVMELARIGMTASRASISALAISPYSVVTGLLSIFT